jgi:hypothetical protein
MMVLIFLDSSLPMGVLGANFIEENITNHDYIYHTSTHSLPGHCPPFLLVGLAQLGRLAASFGGERVEREQLEWLFQVLDGDGFSLQVHFRGRSLNWRFFFLFNDDGQVLLALDLQLCFQ